jgi:hypothetical protein
MYLSHWQWTRGSTSTFFETKLHVIFCDQSESEKAGEGRERELYYWYVRSDEREDSVQV